MLLRVTVCLKHQISFHVICRQNHKWEKWKCVFSESHEFERQKEHSCPYLPKRNKTVKNEKWHSSTHGERTIMWHVKSLLKRTGWISLYSREQQKWNAWQICNERVLLHCFLLFFFFNFSSWKNVLQRNVHFCLLQTIFNRIFTMLKICIIWRAGGVSILPLQGRSGWKDFKKKTNKTKPTKNFCRYGHLGLMLLPRHLLVKP